MYHVFIYRNIFLFDWNVLIVEMETPLRVDCHRHQLLLLFNPNNTFLSLEIWAQMLISLSLSLSHTHQLFWTHSLHLFHKHRLRDTKSLSLTLSFSLSLALSTLWQLHLRLCIPLPSKRSKFLNIWDIFQATSKAFLTKQASKLASERASKVCSWMTIYEAKGSINLWIYFNELLLYEDYKNIQIQGDQIYRFAHR